MKIPWVQCTSSSYKYCIQPHIEAIIMYHQLYMIDSYIIEHKSHYSFDIIMSMGIPTSSIYMSHIIYISPIDENHINTKTKSHHAPQGSTTSPLENPMMFVFHTMSSYPHTSRGNLLTQKISHSALHGLHHPRTPMHDPHLTPTPSRRLKNMKKDLNVMSQILHWVTMAKSHFPFS